MDDASYRGAGAQARSNFVTFFVVAPNSRAAPNLAVQKAAMERFLATEEFILVPP